jgi:imidazolonepropionase-like amidohydrolase
MQLHRVLFAAGVLVLTLAAGTAIAILFADRALPRILESVAERRGEYVFRNVRVLTMGDREGAHEGWSVAVADRRITAVGSADAVTGPAGAVVIDGGGRTLLPGLIDMHVHVFDEVDLAAYLAHGVTTVRNLGGMPFHIGLRDAVEAGRMLGPRLVTSGPIINQRGGRNSNLLQVLVDGPGEARAEVRRQFEDGFRLVKVYSNLSGESYQAILDEARRLGMQVAGHPVEGKPPAGSPRAKPQPFDDVLDDGLTTLEHMESIVWHALDDATDERAARALARRVAAAGQVVDPTLVVHDNLTRQVETRGAHAKREEMERFSPLVGLFEADKFDFWASYDGEDRSRLNAFYVRSTGIFHEEGVELVAGTDAGVMLTLPGTAMARELTLLVRAGLTPREALACATVNAARALGMEHEIGRILPGYRADFILVDGDPLERVGTVEHPWGVMRDGAWLDADARRALHRAAFEVSLVRSLRHGIGFVWSKL